LQKLFKKVKFEDLNLTTPILNALSDMGFVHPTDIQEKAFPVIMSGKDVVGIAQTGTGKTLAYLLPVIRQLKFSEHKHPRVLIMVPTRELVIQVMEEARKVAVYTSLRIDGVYGGANINTQSERIWTEGVDILVATPGRLFDLAMRGTLRLKMVQKLIIDEVDEMLNLGFRHQLVSILELLPDKRQNLMFSATLADDVEAIINDFFFNPEWIDVHFRGTPISRIRQAVYKVPNFATRFNLLSLLLEDDEVFDKVIVFTPSRKIADKVFNKLTPKYGEQLGVIHSNKSQNQRFNALAELKDGLIRILISTDLVARGVDIFEVSHVINFGLPESPGAYIHRIGRTGRVDKDGIAISIITPIEEKTKVSIEELIQASIPEEELPEGLVISKAEDWDEELLPSAGDISYLKPLKADKTAGKAFHDKKTKNKKVNMGGPSKKKLQEARNRKRKKR
jgi:ATP-dependent RNA helicase RhlE